MVENHFVVEQAHEIQALAKELEHFPCMLSDKFVAGGIIAKLPPSWRDFATSLKHKRQEFSVAKLIGSLDVEERARAKDNRGKGVESPAANMVQKKTHLHLIIKRRRTCKRTTIQSLSKLLSLRKKTTRKVEVALFAGVMSIGQVRAQTVNISKKRNQQTW